MSATTTTTDRELRRFVVRIGRADTGGRHERYSLWDTSPSNALDRAEARYRQEWPSTPPSVPLAATVGER